MSRSQRFLGATALAAAMLMTTVVQAMPILQFDRMSAKDQDDYVVLLIKGAEQVLTDDARPDLAENVKTLFTTILPRDKHTVGMIELELNLAALSKADADNLVKDPNAKPLPVELAMIATLKNNQIVLPRSFMHVGDNFRPKDPLSPAPPAIPRPK